MRIVCISDTHAKHERVTLPEGDLLLHAGDLTSSGTMEELEDVADWFVRQRERFDEVIAVAGNHDMVVEQTPALSRALLERGCVYLQDEGVEWKGLRIWGTPWQPRIFDLAFNLDRGEPLAERWRLIPSETDILLTHSPPMGILDRVIYGDIHVGSETLTTEIDRIRPSLHVFGHIHEAYGVLRRGDTTFVNAASLNVKYKPVHAPVVLDFDTSARTFTVVSGGSSSETPHKD